MQLSDYSHRIQWLVKNKAVNAPIKFEEIVMVMIMINMIGFCLNPAQPGHKY